MATQDKALYKHTDHETIDVDLRDDQILQLALDAHKNDITLNQHINNIIKDFLDKDEEMQPKQRMLTEKKNDKVQKRKV